jgi:quercetin dioxygenase-like cupin family protein
MATAGQTIENPVTGERARWLVTAAETGGELVRAEWWARPGGGVRGEHVHAEATERFQVLSGRLTAVVGGERRVFGPGEEAVLPPRVPHAWFNEDPEEDVHMVVEVTPAGHFEETVEVIFGLAREGKVDAVGFPNLLQLAVTMHAFGFEAYPTSPPLPLLKAVAAVLAPVGRLTGKRPTYPRFSAAAAVAA